MPPEELTYREGVKTALERIEEKMDAVDRKVTYTNGKVRKIIIALVLISGIVIGQSFTSVHDIIGLLANGV